jgi:hypothetical protein
MDRRVSRGYEEEAEAEAEAATDKTFFSKNEEDEHMDGVEDFELEERQGSNGATEAADGDEVDPLDAYMQEISQQVEELNESDRQKLEAEQDAMQVDSATHAAVREGRLEDVEEQRSSSDEEEDAEDGESLRRKAAASGKFATVEELIA